MAHGGITGQEQRARFLRHIRKLQSENKRPIIRKPKSPQVNVQNRKHPTIHVVLTLKKGPKARAATERVALIVTKRKEKGSHGKIRAKTRLRGRNSHHWLLTIPLFHLRRQITEGETNGVEPKMKNQWRHQL